METINVKKEYRHHSYEAAMFREAQDHPDPVQHEKWHEVIRKEFCGMMQCGMWQKNWRNQVLNGE